MWRIGADRKVGMSDPYYNLDGITIYHSDTLDVLRNMIFDVAAVIMDPPYASGSRKEAGRSSSGAMVRSQRWAERPIENDQMTTPGFVWMMRETLAAAKPMIRDGGHLLSFIDWRQWPNLVGAVESVNLRVNGMIVWDKQSFGMGHGFRNQHELILHASKGVGIMADLGTPNVLSFRRDSNTNHPSLKPVELCKRLVAAVTSPGDLVLDPFMGSGPVARACLDLGRRYVGIEIVEEYCQAAVDRLGQLALALDGSGDV